MALESSLKECSSKLSSVRATDRKKNGENLKNFLMGSAVPSLLSENTLQSKGYTWNDLFDDISDLVLKETEKYETSKNFDTVMGPLCTNLLHLCVSGANKGRSYIRCDKLIDACLFILRDKRLMKAIGDAYLNLLYKYVLPYDHYLSHITPSAWEDLLDVCLSMCTSKHSKLDSYTKLRLVLLVMKNARNYCQFVVPLRDSIARMKKCFLGVVDDKKVQEVVIEIMILLLETLSAESRLTMCEFTENIVSSILKFYDQNLDQKKKASLFKVLQLMVVLHHPLGRTQHENGSLAKDWGIWKKYLHSMLEIVCLEVNFLQKQRNQDNLLKYSAEFYDLAASVYFQIFKTSPVHIQEEGESLVKRQRVAFNKNKTFCDLVEELRQNNMPWLAIIHVYVKNYGQSISAYDYTLLLSVLETLITNNTNINWHAFEDLSCMVIENLNSSTSTSEVQAVLFSIWNSCMRTSTLVNAAHKPLHSIMQLLLSLDILKYNNVQPLIKMYNEKGVPVTDHSLTTLNHVMHKFYSKCNNLEQRINFFNWIIQGQITSLNIDNIKEFLLKLLATENVGMQKRNTNPEHSNHYDVIFNSVEKYALFSEFELDILETKMTPEKHPRNFELNNELNKEIKEFFENKLSEYNHKLMNQEGTLIEYIKFLTIVFDYFDLLLRYNFANYAAIGNEKVYLLLKAGFQHMFSTLTSCLKENKARIPEQIQLLECVKCILIRDYDSLLCGEVRKIESDFFQCINVVVNRKISIDDGVVYGEDDSMMDPQALRHICICVLAAYCRKRAVGRAEILDFILDPKIYTFTATWDINCALKCIEILNNENVEDPPLESIFFLIQGMCRDLFKNPEVTLKLLRVFVAMLDQFWQLENGKQNCRILVRGYLQRSGKKYYPPHVAAMIYESAAKTASLMLAEHDVDDTYLEAVKTKTKDEVHSVRLYCCYLLKYFIVQLPNNEVVEYLSNLVEIFNIQVSDPQESTLKDEAVNRTVTVFHNYLALVQKKKSLVHEIVTVVIHTQKEKNLDKALVKKVLDKITNAVTCKPVEKYFNDNALFIINFWFLKGNSLDNMPLYLFGYERIAGFLENHLKWIVPADIFWRKGGVVKDSDVLKLVVAKSGKSAESIIEACICNIIVLYLPYYVADKYSLDYTPPGKREWSANAHKMFESTREVLGANKWSTLFVENLSQLMILIAIQLSDPVETKMKYNVDVPLNIKSYQYPKQVFDGILVHMGELIEENILKYLCGNQALAIFKVLFELWGNVLQEKVFEYKVLKLHSYVTFVKAIPLDQPTDAFVCNFACNSVTTAIKVSCWKDEISVFVKALMVILEKILPDKVDIVRKPVLELLSILMIKKEEGFEHECSSLLNYLTCEMKEHLKENEDVVDFITTLSQGSTGNLKCSSEIDFLEKLKTYENSLSCPSRETLTNMHKYLKTNKHFVKKLSEELNTKGFSDDCGRSTIHQLIYSLSNTLKSTTDDKIIIEACNCLSEIGNYDLKTLVTVPPPDTQRVTNIHPKQYFAIAVMTSLTQILFNEDPAITNAISKTLKRLLQYKEGKFALDLEDVDKEILLPLFSTSSNVFADYKINEVKFKNICASDFWVPRAPESHEEWLVRITSAVIEVLVAPTNYLNSLLVVCISKPDICKNILSPLIGLLLECASEKHVKLIAHPIDMFFKYAWNLNFDDGMESSEESSDRKMTSVLNRDHKMIVHYMLDVVNFVRLQRNHYNKRADRTVESLNYLRLDYNKVAWAATLADQNLAAIYYGELWAMEQNSGVPPASPEATTQLTGGEDIQRIFRKCFVSIGEMDAIDGCGTAHLTGEEEKRKHLMSTGQFADALLLHDIALSCGPPASPASPAPPGTTAPPAPPLQRGAVKCLHKSGMHHLALQYIKSLPENEALDDIKYECLSFLGDWSDFVDTRELEEKSKRTNCNPYSILKAYRYSCLKDCLQLQTTPEFDTKLDEPLNRAKRAIARLCQNLNMENCQSVYKVLSKLHLFSDIEDYFSVRSDKMPLKTLLNRWQVNNLPAYNDFKHLEAMISQRSLFLEHAAKAYQTSLPDVVSLQIQYAELSLSNERIQMAQRLLAVVKKARSSQDVALADSQISWAKGHKDIALSLLRNIVLEPDPDVRLTAVSLRQYGIWMAESKRDNSRDIINKYLKKSLEVLGDSDYPETRLKVYYDIAKFADTEYKQVVAYMNSSVFEKKLQCIENMKGMTSLRATQDLSKDERKAITVSDRFGQIDEAEIASTKAEKETFLQLAMRYYLLSLKQCEVNNLSVFRVISLWLDNPCIQLAESDGCSFEQLLTDIPSRKFVTVLPQLVPRLTNETSLFADNLNKIIKRCALEHPHHTLPILFSLKNSHKDLMILNASSTERAPAPRGRAPEPRVAAAGALLAQLAREHKALAKIIPQMEKLCDATISFANYKPMTKEIKQMIPAAECIHKLGHLDAVPVPTLTIPVSHDCKYSHLPTLYSFENYFELVGGINCPKKITCRSSDGRTRILLIKGEDDLRQDAVMQQVFNIVNTLLEKDHVTSRNKLLIRTYKVVPMSRRSGVLEWCEGTMPVGTWLVGPAGAHSRYRPQDISAVAARNYLTAYHKERKSNEAKLNLFIRLLKEFRPVFHYFFTEHYLDPVTWYERRLAYTKSVASSSMVGYILGLGDRHLQNILIDKNTAEVVHIDFGIAFDQGKTLPTPETIPFRLTQDIVAGFGSSGVEGLFRRSCEKTMQLLRDNQETLLTILEVLLCDPLYTWSVTSKQQNVPNTSVNQPSESGGSLAKRALLSVGSKLSGAEGGAARGAATAGQVARLLHAARDPANLSRLYPGWQPYL